jgi:hypothetical protein
MDHARRAAIVAAGSLRPVLDLRRLSCGTLAREPDAVAQRVELQVLGIPLIGGLLVAWGALHILAMADRPPAPALYRSLCIALLIASLLAVYGGMSWSSARLA